MQPKESLLIKGEFIIALKVLIFAQFRAEARKCAKFNTEIMRGVIKVREN